MFVIGKEERQTGNLR